MARARKGFRKIILVTLLTACLEIMLLLALPLAMDLKIPISVSQCPPPISKPLEQRWIGELMVRVDSLYMRVPGAKVLEPAVVIKGVNSSTAVSLGRFRGDRISLSGVSKAVSFVGPMMLNVEVGDKVSGYYFPPNEAYYSPSEKAYVFRYYYPGLPLSAIIEISPRYRGIVILAYTKNTVSIGVEPCYGSKCWNLGLHECSPPSCKLELSSSQPFQYVKLYIYYSCGPFVVTLMQGGKNVYLSARTNYWIYCVLASALVLITVYIGVKRAKRFK